MAFDQYGALRRVVMYSHDTFGLGHLTRTSRLAHRLCERFPACEVVVLTGSPVLDKFKLPAGVKPVRLPPVRKAGHDDYRSPCGSASGFQKLLRDRAEMITQTNRALMPDVFVVDNVPTGMKQELLPTLSALREEQPDCHVVLNLRDILDSPEVIRKDWVAKGTYDVIDRYYDRIHVFGDPRIYDSVKAYDLPSKKTAYLGYVGPVAAAMDECVSWPAGPETKRVLVTVGGGGDGMPVLRCIASILSQGLLPTGVQFKIVSGPLLDQGESAALQQSVQASGAPAELVSYCPHMSAAIASSDLVVCMGGYNTTAELLATAQKALVVPRVKPRQEQLIRAQRLKSLGILDYITPDELEPAFVAQRIASMLQSPSGASARHSIPIDGARGFVNQLEQRFGARPSDAHHYKTTVRAS